MAPLTAKGKKVMASMKKQYGKRAKEVFYASINKGVPGSEKWHGLGEAIKNISGNTGMRKDAPINAKASEKSMGGAIKSPIYKSVEGKKAENYWR